MLQKLYALYDEKAEKFLPPQVHNARGEAVRSFTDGINNPESILNVHAGDFTLYELAEFNCEDGDINSHSDPVKVVNGGDLKIEPSPPNLAEVAGLPEQRQA